MEQSILKTIKKLLGVSPDDSNFDVDIVMHINTVISALTQLGVGPKKGFRIESEKEQWSDFIGTDKLLQMVTSYIYLRVKLIFDPPSSSTVIQAMNEQIKEYEWRISIQDK